MTLNRYLLILASVLLAPNLSSAATIPEPDTALVSAKSIARCADGSTLLVMPSPKGKTLRVSRSDHLMTLQDFSSPIRLFGEEGVLGSKDPSTIGIATEGSGVHLLSSSGQRLNWHSTACPVTGGSTWRAHAVEMGGQVRVEDIVVSEAGVSALYREELKTTNRWRLGLASLENGKLRTRELWESGEALYSARAAWDGNGGLVVVWTVSELMPRIQFARLTPKDGRIAAPQTLHDGTHAAVLAVGDRIFIASEQANGTLRVERHGKNGLKGLEELSGRGGYRPFLASDAHGVVWLFSSGLDQRRLFYRRFMGSGFGAEAECGGAPGAWKLSLGFAVQPFVGKSDDGFAMLHGESLGDNENYRYRFHNLPVPRYSVRDPRHVLFLDLLEVAEIENLQQKVSAAVRSEANPLNLNGPPGAHDAATAGYATVIHENGKFRLWYNGEGDSPGREWVIGYAESADGVHWTKPELNLVEYKGSKKNNLLFPHNTHTPLVIKDERESDPGRRYKMVFESTYEGGTSVYLSWSADGIRWHWPPHRLWGKAPGVNKTVRGFHPWHEPLSSFFFDPLTTHPDYRWKIYGQDIYAAYPHEDENRPRNLSLAHGATPHSFVGYEGNPLMDPRSGHQEDQIHGGLVQPYQGLYVALYQHWWDPDWKVDLRLAVSRDGLHFVRVQPQTPVLPLGGSGSWDSGMLCTPNFFFIRDGKIWLYYRGSVGTLATGRVLANAKDSAHLQRLEAWRMMTGLARLRVDGFAYLTLDEMRQPPQPLSFNLIPKYRMTTLGRLATIPIDATDIGTRALHVNVENFAPGFAWVKAQLRDADSGKVITDYSFEDCDAVSVASLDHRVTWKGSADLRGVKASRIRVEFQVFGALDSPQLYSFWFEKSQSPA